MPTASVTLYRQLVPAHQGVDDALVESELEAAAARHSAAAFGADNYARAMIYFAAHWIEITPGSGAPGAGCPGSAICATGPVGARSSRKAAKCEATAPPGDVLTVYWQRYLDIARTRAVRAPAHITVH